MMYESDRVFCTAFLSRQTHDIKKPFPFSFLFYHSMTSTFRISCSDSVGLLDKNEHQFSLSAFQKRFHTMLIWTIAARLIRVWPDSVDFNSTAMMHLTSNRKELFVKPELSSVESAIAANIMLVP